MQSANLNKVTAAGEELHIPFQLGSELVLRSNTDPTLKAKTTLYGVIPGKAIIFEEPLFSLDERFSGESECFTFGYMHGNYLYTFKSRYIIRMFKNVIGAEFPQEVRRFQIRSSTRIPVNIESEADLGTEFGTLPGRMDDISESGCRLQLPGLIRIQKGSKLSLSFKLPDGKVVDHMLCAVVKIKYFKEAEFTVIGIKFCGPEQTILTVQEFCRMALYSFVF